MRACVRACVCVCVCVCERERERERERDVCGLGKSYDKIRNPCPCGDTS